MNPKFKKSFIVILILSILSLPLYSKSPWIHNKRGVEFGKKKRYKKALKEFDASIDIHNKASSKVFHNKGWLLEMKGDLKEAIKSYEEAIRRNPLQLPSYVKMGYLYYKTGEYSKAVDTGEYVLEKDPRNQEVIKWLPDAYRLKIRKHQDDLIAKKEKEKKKEKEEFVKKKIKKEKIAKAKEEKEKAAGRLYATLDFMIRTAYYFKGNEGYKYMTTPGWYANVPEMIYVNFAPVKEWEFEFKAGNPYLGALSPSLVIHTETLQAIYHLGIYSVGFGCMVNRYRSYIHTGRKLTMNDYKIGVILGYTKDKSTLKLAIYPRAFPRDGVSSSGNSFDVDFIEYDFKYKVDKLLSYFLRISVSDYYYFDHDNEMSNYWGVYELSFGGIYYKYKLEKKFITITVGFTERFYMRDLLNDKPYNFGNGQGWFGINTGKWFEGDPFSGYRAPGHVLFIKAEEVIHEKIFIYQKLSFEMVDRAEDHNEFCLTLGVGGVY